MRDVTQCRDLVSAERGIQSLRQKKEFRNIKTLMKTAKTSGASTPKIIAIDFDGTIVEHCFPLVGPPIPGAIEWIKKFQEAGTKIILWTMRSGGFLEDAVKYLKDNGVELWGINTNPEQHNWTSSPKAYAELFIDDAAFGCPLNPTEGRPAADWAIIGPEVLRKITHEDS